MGICCNWPNSFPDPMHTTGGGKGGGKVGARGGGGGGGEEVSKDGSLPMTEVVVATLANFRLFW